MDDNQREWDGITHAQLQACSTAKEGFIVFLNTAPSLLTTPRKIFPAERQNNGAKDIASAAVQLLALAGKTHGKVTPAYTKSTYDEDCYRLKLFTEEDRVFCLSHKTDELVIQSRWLELNYFLKTELNLNILQEHYQGSEALELISTSSCGS
jgi:hypothetical protein